MDASRRRIQPVDATHYDPPPGNTVMWRGLTRLTDIVHGMQLTAETCG
jgi:hypothetical protein